MMRRLLVLLLLALPLPALAEDDDAMILAVTVESETGATPHTGEMVSIAIKGRYRIPITLETIEQPALADFDWMQLGEDRWGEDTERGLRVVTFERRMALYPTRAGRLEIGPFRHVLQLAKPNGERYDRTILSAPVALDVAAVPEGSARWFPLREIEIADEWSNAPQRLERDGGALRKIVLTVQGTLPEMLPPMPAITGAGVHVLPHPEQRRTLLRPGGPVTQAFWRWTIRPDAGGAGYVDPLDVTYFDTLARETRTITLAAQRVAFADAELGGDPARAGAGAAAGETAGRGFALPPLPAWLALALGAAVGLWAMTVGAAPRPSSRPSAPRRWLGLALALLRRDDPATRRALSALRREGGGAWTDAMLRKVDARLYGRP